MAKKSIGFVFTIFVVLGVILISFQTAFAMQLPGLNVTLTCNSFSYGDFTIIADRNNTPTVTDPETEAYRITITDGVGTVLHLVENLNGLPFGSYGEGGVSGAGFNQGATPQDNVRTYTWVSLAGNGLPQETVYTTTNPDCTSGAPVDSDGDGVPDASDQCPGFDDNIDVDNDGTPDGCDSLIDSDGDGVADSADQCPGEDDTIDANTNGTPDCLESGDSDGDGVPDASDQCPGFDDNIDVDNDGTPDGCDSLIDSDGDGVADSADQCPGQDDTIDANTNGTPDCLESGDSDGDGVPDASDQCPGFDDNIDVDNDGTPDGCDSLIDSDGDGVADSTDQCPGLDDTIDANTNGTPDCLESGDSDGDGVPDASDQCPGFDDNIDLNGNGIPDCVEGSVSSKNKVNSDRDGDGINNNRDNCPDAYNPGQEDGWGSAMGDACDTDWYNMRGIGISGFEQKSGEYHVHGNCSFMADGAPRCPEIARFDPNTFTPGSMPIEVTTDTAGTWSVWVFYLHSNNGADVYQVNVYTTNPPQPGTLIDDRLEIHVRAGSWDWYQRGGNKNYNGN